jgi:hypothetical protein
MAELPRGTERPVGYRDADAEDSNQHHGRRDPKLKHVLLLSRVHQKPYPVPDMESMKK